MHTWGGSLSAEGSCGDRTGTWGRGRGRGAAGGMPCTTPGLVKLSVSFAAMARSKMDRAPAGSSSRCQRQRTTDRKVSSAALIDTPRCHDAVVEFDVRLLSTGEDTNS